MNNPFVCGTVVSGEDFVNREDLLKVILDRVSDKTGTSVALVGAPRSGKSSIFAQILNPTYRVATLSSRSTTLMIHSLDVHRMPTTYSPYDFWNDVLETIACSDVENELVAAISAANKLDYSPVGLERVFAKLATSGRRLLLLVDEFDALLEHPQFQSPVFFTTLRSLATTYKSLVVTCATADLSAMTRRWLLLPGAKGSEAFNYMWPYSLPPFDDKAMNQLLSRGLPRFDMSDIDALRLVAGPNPALLQTFAWQHFRDKDNNPSQPYFLAACASSDHHFSSLWQYLDSHARAALLIVALSELEPFSTQDSSDLIGECKLSSYVDKLRILQHCGLVYSYGVSERPRIASFAAIIWLVDNILPSLLRCTSYERHVQVNSDIEFAREQWVAIHSFLHSIQIAVSNERDDLLTRMLNRYLPWPPGS